MILKEAYHYQRFLDNLIYEANELLLDRGFITTTTQTHKIKEASITGDDKVVVVQKPTSIEAKPKTVIDLLVKLIDEKKKLSDAIVMAKKSTEIDMDSAVAMNKKYHEFISVLNNMLNTKAQERETNGTGYRLNQTSGSQERFNYVINEVTVIDYPRDDVRNLIKKYTKLADEVSAKLDLLELTTEVEYDQVYDTVDTFENVLESVVE